jgi:hypothetical protein
MFITGVNNTSDKLFTGVNNTGNNPCHIFSMIVGFIDTGDKFLTCDNDTGNKFITGDNNTGEQLSPVTVTPAINLLPVTRTRTPQRWGNAKDRRKLKGTNP